MEYLCEDVFCMFNEKIWTYLFSLEKIQRANKISIEEKQRIFVEAYKVAELINLFSKSIISYIEKNNDILIEEMGKPILNIMQLIHSNQNELLKYMKNDNISYTEEELINKMIDKKNKIVFDKEKINQMLCFKGFINNKIFDMKKIEISDEMSL
jgi:hypothetical protein